jgi:hypothetical protein
MPWVALAFGASVAVVGLAGWWLLVRAGVRCLRRRLNDATAARLFGPTDNPTAIPFGILAAIAGSSALGWAVDRCWAGNIPVETARGIAVVAWLLLPIPVLLSIHLLGGSRPTKPQAHATSNSGEAAE